MILRLQLVRPASKKGTRKLPRLTMLQHVLLDNLGNSLTLVIGLETYTASDDDAFGSGSPFLVLESNELVSLGFSTSVGGVQLESVVDTVTGIDAAGGGFTATWDFETYTMSPIPLPGAAWLFGSALIGLLGLARRKHA